MQQIIERLLDYSITFDYFRRSQTTLKNSHLYKGLMREIKVLYSHKHSTIEASKFKCGTYRHKAKVVATFYDLETAEIFIARVLSK